MTNGSDGSEYPDYGPPPPRRQRPGQYPGAGDYQGQQPDQYPGQPDGRSERRAPGQAPYYGDSQRRPQPRGYNRPEPYDPFQIRARDEAAGRGNDGQSAAQGYVRQGGDGRSYDGRSYGGGHNGGAYNGDAYNDGHGNGYANGAYGGDAYRTNPYGQQQAGYGGDRYGAGRDDDGYSDARNGQGDRGYGSARSRAADRLGATSLLDERELSEAAAGGPRTDRVPSRRRAGEPGDTGDPRDADAANGTGGRSLRRRGKKAVPPHILRRRKIIRRSILGAFLVFFGYVGITLYPYLTAPGTDRLAARVAEWGRDHHLGWAVTWLENASYKPPPTGGKLDAGQLAQLQGATAAPPPKPDVDLPGNIPPLAAGSIPGEGVWHPVTMDANGVPIVEKAALRSDAQHTSDLAYVVWMNQKKLRFNLHPGYQQPGGTWNTPDTIPADQRANLVATWNGGFKVKPDDALAGFYMDGKSAVPLVSGKAAEVFYNDGSIKIGQWGRDESMGPTIAAVRQNLSLLVDNGKLTVGPGDGSSAQWGYTIKNSYFIARSGVGMTAKGDIVYVSGRFLSVYTLAKLLQAAGAVDAMELDINPDWVSFMSYGGSDPAHPTPTKLWDFTQPADRYFQPSDRDFVSVYKR